MKNVVLLSYLAAFGITTSFAASPVDEIRVERSRPLAGLAAEMRNRYGYLVTYEDAPVDTKEIVVERRPNGLDFRHPAWKPVVFHVRARTEPSEAADATPGTAPGQIKPLGPDVIGPLVAEYRSSGNPGKFTVVYDGEYAHIIPAGRVVDGRIVDFEPILSTVVQFNQAQGSCLDLLDALLAEVQQIRSVKFTIVNVPLSPLSQQQCSVTRHGIAARQVLMQLLDGMARRAEPVPGVPCAWSLIYDQTTEAYFLDARPVWDYRRATANSAPATTVPPKRQESAGEQGPLPATRLSKGISAGGVVPKAVGTVVLETNTRGGVFVDDQFYGIAPMTLTLAAGKHTITVKVSGYKDWTKDVSTEVGTETHLTVTPAKVN